MKMRKMLASFAMVGTLTALCAGGVFAATAADFCSDYTETTENDTTIGSVTVTAPEDYSPSGDYTVLVIHEDANEKASLLGTDIYQIDQNAEGDFTLKFNPLADGTYYVRLGGAESGYVYDTFTVGEVDEPEMVLIGDVDDNDEVGVQDAAEVAKNCAHLSSAADTDARSYLAAAYCDGNNEIGVQDASEVAKYCAHLDTTYVNTSVVIGTYGDAPTE